MTKRPLRGPVPDVVARRAPRPLTYARPRASVPKLWPGSTIVCIGGGPSLTRDDVEYCRGRARVVAINDAYRLAPWADVLYGCDLKWWKHHKGVMTFGGRKYALSPMIDQGWGVEVLRNDGPLGLCLNPTGLRAGSNSGFQAINLAVHLGARRILLLGYDMSRDAKKRSHWFGEHQRPLGNPVTFEGFLEKMKSLPAPLKAIGVEVINCSRRTALHVFPEQPLEEALPADSTLELAEAAS